MAAPSPAGPPRLPMMTGLALDEHPTHAVRDHLLTAAWVLVFGLALWMLSR